MFARRGKGGCVCARGGVERESREKGEKGRKGEGRIRLD